MRSFSSDGSKWIASYPSVRGYRSAEMQLEAISVPPHLRSRMEARFRRISNALMAEKRAPTVSSAVQIDLDCNPDEIGVILCAELRLQHGGRVGNGFI